MGNLLPVYRHKLPLEVNYKKIVINQRFTDLI